MRGDLVASVSPMVKVDSFGKTFSNGIQMCPILIDYFVYLTNPNTKLEN